MVSTVYSEPENRREGADLIVGDYIGRTYIPSIPSLLFKSHPKILFLSISRVIFVPLFLACNLSTTPGSPYLNSDIIYLVILTLFGITNGSVMICIFHDEADE